MLNNTFLLEMKLSIKHFALLEVKNFSFLNKQEITFMQNVVFMTLILNVGKIEIG